MNTNTRKRGAILLAVVAMMLLACSTSTFISRREEPTATPAKTLRPTFTSTPPPGMASSPASTPVPGDAVSVPGDAVLEPGETASTSSAPVSSTHTPVSPVSTGSPPATNVPAPPITGVPGGTTPEPTASPAGQPSPTATQNLQPSATPGPLSSWTGQVSSKAQDCGLTRLLGLTRDRNGELAGGIWVHYWADGGDSKWSRSYPMSIGAGPSLGESEANWDGLISPYPIEGFWHVCVVDASQSSNCLSNTIDVEISSDCNSGDQVIHITFLEN